MLATRILFAAKNTPKKKLPKKAKTIAPAQSSARWARSRWNPEHWKVPPWNLYNCIRCLPTTADSTGYDPHKNGLGLMFYRRKYQTLEPTYWTITKNRIANPARNQARNIWGIFTWRGQTEPRPRKIRYASAREWWHLKSVEGWTREPHVKRFFYPEEAHADLLANLEIKKAQKEAAPKVTFPPNRAARRAASKGRGKAAKPAAAAAPAKKKEK